MSEDAHARLREIFETAAELAWEQRGAYLDTACAGDASLRAEIEDLLRRDDAAGETFLRSPVVRPGATTSQGAALPATIGRYRVTGRLGAGGMGVVYEGTQESPQRAVALKVIRADLLSERLLARFRNEAEILGRLEHPGIARIYEAGMATLEAGGAACPFFAMELVRGTPLLEHARDLGTDDRLRLFAEICDAVHHAHQKGVIHRDLKPANILVTTTDEGDAQPKVLDFGVARATDGDIQVVTVQTDVGQLLGTVPYMSPEQVTGDLGRLDTRSDVYSLGVVLFELLTGALPYDVRERSIVEAARIIRDDRSTRLSTILPALRGDLEWIVAKAMEKDIDRRYDSASALAADIRRHLADEPVLAGPPSAAYRVRKFVRRNRVWVAWSAAAVLLLVAGVAATVAESVRATRAEKDSRAAVENWRRETERGRLSSDVLVWALASAAPDDTEAVRRSLDTAGLEIEDRFGFDPSVEADAQRMIGDVYAQLGAYAPARVHLLRAYELMTTSPEADMFVRSGLAEVLTQLNACERELGNGEPAAARWYFECLDVIEAATAHRDPALAGTMRAMRSDLIARDAPARSVQDEHLDRVMTVYAHTPDRNEVGRGLSLYLIYMTTYVGNVFGESTPSYVRAEIEILDGLDRTPRSDRLLGVALWLAARNVAPAGEEEWRIVAARRLVDGEYGWANWVVPDAEISLGAALVQRGREADRAEIADRLTAGSRGLRELTTPESGHALLERRRALSLRQLAAADYDERRAALVDQTEILDELAAGIEAMSIRSYATEIAESMQSREGRSARWYEVAALAARRADALAAADAPDAGTNP